MEPALSGCFICYNTYDLEAHIPRILPQCGHTLCEYCIKNLLDEPVPKCPFDKVVFASRNITSFPQNYVLREMLDQRASLQLCQAHGDKIRFGCVTCKKRICSYCAFVEHKEHTVKPIEDMEADIKRRKQELEKFVETVDKEKSNATDRIEELRKTLESEVKRYFEDMFQSLHERKSQVEKLISKIFLAEKDKFKSKLYVYEIEKIRVLGVMNGPQDFYSITDTTAPNLPKFLDELSQAETNFESAYRPQLEEINKSLKELSMDVQENLSKLDIPNLHVEQEQKEYEYEVIANKSLDFDLEQNWDEEEFRQYSARVRESERDTRWTCQLIAIDNAPHTVNEDLLDDLTRFSNI